MAKNFFVFYTSGDPQRDSNKTDIIDQLQVKNQAVKKK